MITMESTICSVEQLKQLTSISQNMDCELLQPHLLISQQINIAPILGDALYHDIITRYDNQTLTGDSLTLYNDYIIPAIGFGAWHSASPFIAYKTNRSGIQTQGTPDTVAVTPEELSLYMARVENLKNFYCDRLNDYLIADNGIKFPLFRAADTPINSSKGGTLFLNFKRNGTCDGWC